MQLNTETGSAHKTLDDAEHELVEALRELRRLAAGIHPAVLTDRGLPAALEQLAAHSPVPVQMQVDEAGRFPQNIESTMYFCASEAVTNAVKHAHATTITLCLAHRAGRLVLSVTDDGIGGADPQGTGLRGLTDRLAVFGGTLTVRSAQGAGTQITAELPCASSSSMTT